MKRLCILLLICLSALIATPVIAANVVVFQDDFEGYTASPTWPSSDDADPQMPPVGDFWSIYEPLPQFVQVQSTPSGTNYCAGPHGGSNYLQAYTAGTAPAAMIPSAGQSLISEYQNLTLDMWLYKNQADGWNGLQTIGAYDNDQPAISSAGRSFLLYFRQDGKLQYFDDGLIDTGITYTPDTWMHLVVEANFLTQTYDVTLNGQTVSGLNFDTQATNVQHVLLYGSTDVDSNSRAAFDDIVMFVEDSTVPEPSVLAGLLGIFAIAAVSLYNRM